VAPREVDELTRLREELAKAEAQVAQLKLEKAIGKGPTETHEFHAKPLGPNMMPDAKAKIAREEKMYYRLGLYKIDRLCSNETANLLKVWPQLPPHFTCFRFVVLVWGLTVGGRMY
jgi:hypothetical protein